MPAYIKEIVHRNLNAARDSAVSLWIGLIVGVPVALAEVFYLKGITVIYDLRAVLGNWTLIGMPFAGLLIVYLMNTFGKDCNKGINHIFRIVQGKEHSLSLRVIPLMILTIWLSHLVGASVGRATGVIQIGVAIALWLGHMLHLDNDKIRLTVSGLAAGFACLFGTPITAIFFSLEMFVSGALQYKGLGAAIVSATVASLVAKACGLVPMRYDLPLNYTFSYIEFVKIGLLGICCGWVGSFMAWSLKFSRKQLKKYFPNPYRRVFVSSCFIAIMMFLCWHGRYSGLSRDLLDTAIAGQIDMPWDWVLKIFFTILCLAAGFQGGEVMPLCVIGATFGSYFGNLLGLPVPFSAALGIAAVFASGTNTLVAPIFFGTELFHGHYARYFAIVCALSFYCNHNRSIYEKQRRLRS